jgi:hypothetical protein
MKCPARAVPVTIHPGGGDGKKNQRHDGDRGEGMRYKGGRSTFLIMTTGVKK